MSRTYVLLKVSRPTYDEIYAKLVAAGYQQAFHEGQDGLVIDMHGIAVARAGQEGSGMALRHKGRVPQWRSHKEVWAEKVKAVMVISPPEERTPPTEYDVTIVLHTGEELHMSKICLGKGIASSENYYFVQDAHGVQSLIPAREFEDEYVRM